MRKFTGALWVASIRIDVSHATNAPDDLDCTVSAVTLPKPVQSGVGFGAHQRVLGCARAGESASSPPANQPPSRPKPSPIVMRGAAG